MIRNAGNDRFKLAARFLAALAVATIASCGGSGRHPLPPPSDLSYASPQIYAVGTAITPLSPSVMGTVTRYSVTPALPDGLTLNTTNGVVSGTPNTLSATADYRIMALNASGYSAYLLTLTIAGVEVVPGRISRMVFSGTSVFASVSILPRNFEISGTLSSVAEDAAGVFATGVTVTAGDDGSYALTLATAPNAPEGHQSGQVTLSLCADPACNTRQAVQSVNVDFAIDVMTPTTAWPGDNLTPLASWPGVPDWTMFQGNAAHTGHVPATVDPNQFSTRWRLPALPLFSGYYERLGTPVASDGRFFVAGDDRLFARSEFDGQELWEYDFSGLDFPSVNPPAVGNGFVYVAAGQQSSTFLFAFNAADGSLVFKSPMSSQFEHYLAPTIGETGIYANAGTYGGLFAFDPTGVQMYFEFMDQTSVWTPAVDGTGVYSYTGGILKVNDPASGALIASIDDPTFQNYVSEIGGSPVLGAPGSVFVANYLNSILNGGDIGNTLTKFETSAGAIGWQIPGVYPSTPAYANGVLYVANERPLRLEARAEADGSLLWSWTPPFAGDRNFNSEVLLTDNLAFISTNKATYAIDLASHQTVWSYPLMGRLALSQSGILYVRGKSQLAAINLK